MKFNGKVLRNKEIAENIWKLDINAGKQFKSLPGQFINVLINDTYEPLLRRPFSIFEASDKKVSIVYKVLGAGTKALAEKKSGDSLDFIGPLGRSYLEFLKRAKNASIIVIGGGTGAASVHYLAKHLRAAGKKFVFIQGARSACNMVAVPEFKKLGCSFSTDDGSLGEKGFVSDLLQKKITGGAVIFACGPKPMFRAIKQACANVKNVKIYASFEEYMGCGIGACLSCVIETTDGTYKRVCKDGTVFDLNDVVI
jgi:dihydroorotate dehydrogenase electron transfer subunit